MKIKFPIILKIGLLGVLASSIAAGVALTVSSVIQTKRSEETLIDNIDQALYSVEYKYSAGETGASLVESLIDIKDYILGIYSQEDVHDKKLEDFSSFDEYEAYFKNKQPWIFPRPDALDGRTEFFQFQAEYHELSQMLISAHLASSGRAAYVCFTDEDEDGERLVFINDSRIFNSDLADSFYHLPSSHYVIKDTDYKTEADDEGYAGYMLAGYLTRMVPIYQYDSNGDGTLIAYLYIEYDTVAIKEQNKKMLLTELGIISGVMVMTILVYMLLAHLAITRNLNKLTKKTDRISADLKAKKEIKPTKLNFKMHDEIASLSSSFELMEQEIANYVSIIKAEAKENERRLADLEVSSKIQLNSLPPNKYIDGNLHLVSYIKPAKVVGGDFYDYFYNKDKFVVLIADVSGKGVPAALFMMKAKELIKSKILSGLSLVDAVSEANNELTINNEESLFVTAFIASIDFSNNVMSYVNAGHEKPYILHQNQVIKLDGDSNFVLGGEENIDYHEEQTNFEVNDSIFIFTDGLNESINKDKEEFGYERIQKTLEQSINLSLEERIDLFNSNLKEFVGEEEQFDDVTMVTLTRLDNKLHLIYDAKDYSIIEDATDKFMKAYPSIDGEIKSKVGIALDELLNNLISYEKKDDLKIELDFEYSKKELKVIITSNGGKFDPFENMTGKYIEEGTNDIDGIVPGGFGISLVASLTKERSYSYKNGKSITTLIFGE